jgi:hypothetical protein
VVRHVYRSRAYGLPLSVLVSFGCGGSDLTLPLDIGAPASISVVKGDDQTGTAGMPLRDSLVVRVTDGAGNPVPGQQVVFVLATETPGADVAPDVAITGPDGMASTRWVLGGSSETQSVVARVVTADAGNLEVRFSASASAPTPDVHGLRLRTQPSSSASVGVELERQPVIQIRDAEGNDVERGGVSVTAAVASGAGALVGTTTRVTASNGRAEFTDLRVNGATGAHVLIFAADGYTSVTAEPIDVRPVEAPPPPPPPPPPADNQPPVAADDEYNSIEGYENILRVDASAGLLHNDRDPEGGPLTAREVTDPPNGHVTVNSDGSFTYGPEPSFFGDDRFTYRVEDEQGKSSTATVTIHVAPLNDRPRFTHRGDVTVSANEGPRRFERWARSISPGADNESNQILTFEVSNDNPGLFTSGGQPKVTRDGPQSETGTLTFTPSGRSGTADVTVILRDNGGDNLDTSKPPAHFRIRVR